jgi:putative Flp pilus-assembly TadE/G-like protein
VLLVLFLMSLLGVAAFVIDYGLWSVNRSQVQSAADAAALAGATGIPGGWGTSISYANGGYANNGKPADSHAVASSSDLTPNDSVTVTASRSVNAGFAGIFGIHPDDRVPVRRGRRSSRSPDERHRRHAVGLLQSSYTPGQPYPIYTKDTTNANNGAISLPYVNNANCPVPSGASIYSDEVAGSTQVCPVSVGETVQTKPGNNNGTDGAGPEPAHHELGIPEPDRPVPGRRDREAARSQQPAARDHPRPHEPERPERLAQRHERADDRRRLRLVS